MSNRWITAPLALLVGAFTAFPALSAEIEWAPGPGIVAYEDRAVGDIYLVLHQAAPVATYAGGLPGLAATAAPVLGRSRLDLESPAALEYLGFLSRELDSLIARAEAAIGRPLVVQRRLRHALTGFTARLTPEEARLVAALPGVARVEAPVLLSITSDNGPAWINADALYDGSGTFDGVGTQGEGVVVGIIDTGINVNHPSFAAVGPVDGYVHVNPRSQFGTKQFYGQCLPGTGFPFCNDKLIGVWDFTGTSPLDDNGHGSHVASTAAGNWVDAELVGPTLTLTRRIGGVAPHAHIISYKACLTTPALGGCLSPSTASAIDQAVADRVDVLNFSIGGASRNPWSDANAQAFLAARAAGVFVATSAGNSGPGPGTVGSPADAPWVLSVAASTHDRALANALTGLTGGASPPPPDLNGRSLTAGLSAREIVYAGDFGDPLCLAPFAAGSVSDKIVVCDRGQNARVEKAENVAAGGAAGFVLVNDEANGASLNGDAYVIPGVHLSFADGQALKTWLADGGSGHRGAIRGTEATNDRAAGDVMAGFSSRGPNPAAPGVIKPDITAPGVDIIAAVNVGGLGEAALEGLLGVGESEVYGVLSGTSMSSPHATGAAALLRALHPEWTPDQLQSALMTTAFARRGRVDGVEGLVKDDRITPADPFDVGAGRIDLARAARAGLLLDETEANYRAADPSRGGDPTALNRPSLGHAACAGSCEWTRRLTATVAGTWTAVVSAAPGVSLSVSPAEFSLPAGGAVTLSVRADTAGAVSEQWHFGAVTLVPADRQVPETRLPVAVRVPEGSGIEAPPIPGDSPSTHPPMGTLDGGPRTVIAGSGALGMGLLAALMLMALLAAARRASALYVRRRR